MMLSFEERKKRLKESVVSCLESTGDYSRDKIIKETRRFSEAFFPDSSEDQERAIQIVTEELFDTTFSEKSPFIIAEDDDSRNLPPIDRSEFFSRYCAYLQQDGSMAKAIDSIDAVTEKIVTKLADPKSKSERIRGLVVADVQSGKTANYIGLIAKAFDIGYRSVIVLSGIHNNLRKQTQERIDAGIIGSTQRGSIGNAEPIGVGLLPAGKENLSVFSFTTAWGDVHNHSVPSTSKLSDGSRSILVTKKNIQSLTSVLKICDSGQIAYPLLLIDDEADNASINVGRNPEDVSRINGLIRKILSHDSFPVNSYVGYTATPFANVLVNANVDDEVYGEDIFPKDFIILMRSSEEYFGANKVFSGEDDKYLCRSHLEEILPQKHSKDFILPNKLTDCIKDAICHFLINVAIESASDKPKHRSMMVNVSRFVQVQEQISRRLKNYLDGLVDEIRSAVNEASSLQDFLQQDESDEQYLRRLVSLWQREFISDQESFDLLELLRLFTKENARNPIKIVVINGDSPDELTYEDDALVNVIAIGGDALSRGLTLEGLVTSYFARNSRSYDTLMQMCRWFGYRASYEHRCRIWLPAESQGWYEYITRVVAELYDEIENLVQRGIRPRDLALKIRKHPDRLIITSVNKQKSSKDYFDSLDVSCKLFETLSFIEDHDTQYENESAFIRLINDIEQDISLNNRDLRDSTRRRTTGAARTSNTTGRIYQNVPVERILAFLNDYRNENNYSPKTQTNLLSSAIRKMNLVGEALYWRVLIASGKGGQVVLSNSSIEPIFDLNGIKWTLRSPGTDSGGGILLSGDNRRLSGRGIGAVGLEQSKYEEIRKDYSGGNNPPDSLFIRHFTEPVLVLFPLKFKNPINGLAVEEAQYIGWTIMFPPTNVTVESHYVVNSSLPNDVEDQVDEN
ncbi:hypothetical protein BSR28_01795 [Boudabousia liubingyangii]|uniref:Z1 domain-containing protein n=1 Tax=Boudabousia liubingyangii TaxID=1921764 RepID=UPI000960A08A|nr:Z1 domain-containing protein [Boudabousia liubingyangii]OKL48458.1 hypothetical protein BSR28_01795 [Boudabousia liubingyangii]